MQLRMMESDLQLTIVPFEHGLFDEVLKRQLSRQFGLALNLLANQNRRDMVAGFLDKPAHLTSRQLDTTRLIALDESEDKHRRKSAIRALANRGAADADTVVELLGSNEQGIQRLTLSMLDRLSESFPTVDPDFFAECVAVANLSDDVGLARRLIPSLLEISLPLGIDALSTLMLSEVGTRRRITDELEKREADIGADNTDLTEAAIDLLNQCRTATNSASWETRCAGLIDRLKDARRD